MLEALVFLAGYLAMTGTVRAIFLYFWPLFLTQNDTRNRNVWWDFSLSISTYCNFGLESRRYGHHSLKFTMSLIINTFNKRLLSANDV